MPPRRDPGLTQLIFGTMSRMDTVPEIRHLPDKFRICFKVTAEETGRDIQGDIIFGRPQSAAEDENIAAALRQKALKQFIKTYKHRCRNGMGYSGYAAKFLYDSLQFTTGTYDLDDFLFLEEY